MGGGAPRWMQVDSPAEAFRRLETISCGAMPAARIDRTRERIQQSLRVRCERGCRRMCCLQIVKEPGRMAPRKRPRRSLHPVLPHGGKAAFAAMLNRALGLELRAMLAWCLTKTQASTCRCDGSQCICVRARDASGRARQTRLNVQKSRGLKGISAGRTQESSIRAETADADNFLPAPFRPKWLFPVWWHSGWTCPVEFAMDQ